MSIQDSLYQIFDPRSVNRRWFLQQCGVGIGTMALGDLLTRSGYASGISSSENPFQIKPPHHAPTTKNIIFLFMS